MGGSRLNVLFEEVRQLTPGAAIWLRGMQPRK